jgi:NAD(P)-dependent dehydrogenase (short-subunit alcohol dehydrogenase family)
MENKVVLVTGGTGGIGFEAAKELAAGGATVVIVGRDAQRGEAAVQEISGETGNPRLSYLRADLSELEQIEQLVRDFESEYDRLDVLVNNAGAVFWSRAETAEGLEMTFALNHLGYFRLTHLLLPLLLRSAPSRIINVSSGAHQNGTIDFDDLMQEQSYSAWGAYSQSKLANILFTRELARRLEGSGVTANALHPGFVATGFGRGRGLVGRVLMPLAHLFATSPEEGARTIVYLAASSEVEGVSGKYFVEEKERRPAPAARNDEAARHLWEVSERLSGLPEPFHNLLAVTTV